MGNPCEDFLKAKNIENVFPLITGLHSCLSGQFITIHINQKNEDIIRPIQHVKTKPKIQVFQSYKNVRCLA